MASVLAHRDYRWLWTSSLFSWAAQWIQQASMGWVVYEITGSGTLLGVVMGARAIPMLLLAPLSGVAADRYDRRRLLWGGQALAAAVSLALGVGLALGLVQVWMLFVFMVLMGASNVLDRPARFTTVFDLVPRDQTVKAVALNTVGFSAMRVLGPALAGWLIAELGAAGTFFVQALLYGTSFALVFAIAIPPRKRPGGDRSALSEMVDGFRFAFTHPGVRALLLVGALPYLLLVPVVGTLYPIFAKDAFAGGPQTLGALLAAVGAGGVAGGFVVNLLARYPKQGRVQAAWVAVMALGFVALALSPTLAVALPFSFIAGAAEMAHTASNMAMLQLAAPEALRGRIASLTMLYPALISVGALFAGPLADLLGVRGATLLLAGAALLAVGALYLSSPNLREFRNR